MKTRLLTSILALFSFVTYCQTTIDDLNFEYYLEYHDANGGSVPLGDPSSMGDGIEDNHSVPTSKINTVQNLDVSSLNISSLVGIEDFIGLLALDCSNNNLTELNLSTNTSLGILHCEFNMLNSLTLPNTISLVWLYCNDNQLTSLNVSNNTGLKLIYCGNNQITGITLTGLTNLDTLHIESNDLLSLDVSTNTKFYDLNCSDNSISTLDLFGLADLFYLDCSQNLLTELDLSFNFQLVQVNISANNLNPTFTIGGGSLLNLNCSNNPNLLVLNVMGPLTTLYVSNCSLNGVYFDSTDLQELELSNNNLPGLSIVTLPNLTYFNCSNNQLTSLDLRNGHNVDLTNFSSFNNPSLNCIDVDNVTTATNKTTAGDWLVDAGVIYSTDCVTMGIEEFAEDAVLLYPNPVKDKLNIELKSEGTYHLTNIFGQEIKVGHLISSHNALDVHNLFDGLYFLNIDTEQGHATKKIIKN